MNSSEDRIIFLGEGLIIRKFGVLAEGTNDDFSLQDASDVLAKHGCRERGLQEAFQVAKSQSEHPYHRGGKIC